MHRHGDDLWRQVGDDLKPLCGSAVLEDVLDNVVAILVLSQGTRGLLTNISGKPAS